MFLRVDRDLINADHVIRITESGNLRYFELTNGKSVSCRREDFADGASPDVVIATPVAAPPGFLLLRPSATDGGEPVERIEVVAFLVDASGDAETRVMALGWDGTRGPEGDVGLMSPGGSVRVAGGHFADFRAYLDHIVSKKIV